MSFDQAKFNQYIEENRSRFLNEFAELVGFDSVAADKRPGLQHAADWITRRLEKIGAKVTQYPLPNNAGPVIVAEVGYGERTLMVYNHYDVQPETPLEGWDTPPFELTIKDGVMYGRGTADDKGELLSRIQCVEAWQATQGDLPIRIKFIYEGEEEVGSVHLDGWAEEHRDLLAADGCLWEGGGYDEVGRTIMAEGCKGIAYFELRLTTAAYDIHSSMAPMIENAAWRLVWALASMKDAQDRITIDGYWDYVQTISPDVIRRIHDEIPFEAEKVRQNYELKGWINGMNDIAAHERHYVEPTMTIAGFGSGHLAEGAKTIIPASGIVKLDFRLVPNLTPDIVENLMRTHLDKRGFSDIEIVRLAGEMPVMVAEDNIARRAAIQASLNVFEQEPIIHPWFTGSGPVYPLSLMVNVPMISGGATWHPKARAHAPNENIFVEDYFKSIQFMAAFVNHFATA